jgi:hypothetical protein
MFTDEPQEQMFPKPFIPIQKQQQIINKKMFPKLYIQIKKKKKKNTSFDKNTIPKS